MPKKKVKKTKAKATKRKAPKKPAAKRKVTKKAAKKAVAKKTVKPKIEGKLIGYITHFFPHVQAAALKIKKGTLEPGENIRIKGHTTDFKMTVASLQLDHAPISKAKTGQEIGMRVSERVREGDEIYKL